MTSERIAGKCKSCGEDILVFGKGVSPQKDLCSSCIYKFIPDEGDSEFAPKGECQYCDEHREMGTRFMPSHYPSSRCRSNGRSHCTCDTCF